MTRFDLEWGSTIEERLGEMSVTADAFIAASGVRLLDSFGGQFSPPVPGTPEADNGFTIETDEATAERLASELSAIVKHHVTVTERMSDPTETHGNFAIKVDGEEIDHADTRAEAKHHRDTILYGEIGTEANTTIEPRS